MLALWAIVSCPQSGRGIALVRTYQSLLKAIGTLNSSNPNLHTHTSRVEAQNLQVTQVAGYCGACHGTLINHPAGGTFPCSACLGILSTTPVGFARIQAQSQTLPGRRKEAKAWPGPPSAFSVKVSKHAPSEMQWAPGTPGRWLRF